MTSNLEGKGTDACKGRTAAGSGAAGIVPRQIHWPLLQQERCTTLLRAKEKPCTKGAQQ